MARKTKSGAVHQHGPKRNLFHDWTRSARLHMANAGLLTKYNNFESFKLALIARGVKNPVKAQFDEMNKLPTRKAKDEWFAAIRK